MEPNTDNKKKHKPKPKQATQPKNKKRDFIYKSLILTFD